MQPKRLKKKEKEIVNTNTHTTHTKLTRACFNTRNQKSHTNIVDTCPVDENRGVQ